LGEIPKGWKVVPLSEITTVITKGTTPTQEDIDTAPDADAHIDYVRVNAIDENGAILEEKLTTIPKSVHLGVLRRSVLRANDVLYTIAGTIGRISIVDEYLLPANTNQAVAIIRPKPMIPPAFLTLTMRQVRFREELHSNVVHAVQANLSLGMLSKARLVAPREDTLLRLFMPIDDIVKRISSVRAESRTLAALRDTLLPKLISGHIRVKNAERFLKARGP
jgi:type I restriction enzyme S subunit